MYSVGALSTAANASQHNYNPYRKLLYLGIRANDRHDFKLVLLVIALAIGVQLRSRFRDGLLRRPATGNRQAVVLAIEMDEIDFPIEAAAFR